jgi:hypothetical protein
MKPSSIKAWLRRTPRPAAVLCDDQRVEVGKGQSMTDLLRSIEALNPTKITCVDAEGTVLRARSIDAEEGAGQPVDDTDPDDSPVQAFAKLIAAAYEKSTLHSGKLHETSMGFIERQALALQRAEQEIERLRASNAKLRAENLALVAELNAAPEEESLAGAVMAGFAQKQLAEVANGGKPNGAKSKGATK